MREVDVSELRLAVESRGMGGNGGPTLRVFATESGRELLRFDCFGRGAHWHIDPGGTNLQAEMPDGPAGVDFTLGQLSDHIDPLLASAGHVRAEPLGRSDVWDRALARVAHWMRESTR